MRKIKLNDTYRVKESFNRINSKVKIYNEFGELLFKPLHNKTVVSGSILTAMKLFNLNPSILSKTPSYDELLNLEKNNTIENKYPSISLRYAGINFNDIRDESRRRILGFCIGLDPSIGESIMDSSSSDYITPDHIIPFRLIPLKDDSLNDISNIYSGRAIINDNEEIEDNINDDYPSEENDTNNIEDSNYNNDEYYEDAGDGTADINLNEIEDEEYPEGREGIDDGTDINTEYYNEEDNISSKSIAYYFKGFDTVEFHQQAITDANTNEYSEIEENDSIMNYDNVQTYVKLKFTISKDDCREYFNKYMSKNTENNIGEPRFNQISLVSGWVYEVEYRAYATAEPKIIKHFQDVRPFSILNIPSKIFTNDENINIEYTLYF